MLKKFWSATKYYFFLTIGMVLLYLVFKDVNFVWMWNEIKHADFEWILLSFLFGIVAMASRAWRWKIMLEPLGYTPSFLDCFNGVAIGYLSNIGLPRMGEVVRCSILNQTNGIPITKLIGTVILERVIDVIMLLSLILVVFFSQIDRFGKFFMTEIFGDKIARISLLLNEIGTILIPAFIVFCIASFLIIRWVLKKYSNHKIIIRISEFLKGLSDGVITLFKMKRKGEFIFHSLLIWVMYFVMTWVCFFAYDPTSALTALDGLFLMVVGGLGMTAPVQGGFGAFHYLVEKALLLYNIKPSIDAITGIELRPGLVFATIVHSTQFIMTLLLGLTAVILVALKKKKRNAKDAA
jgi:uncharacterized protein (TIRG00374 family)